MAELASSPTSIISCGRDYLTDKEVVLRWKLLDAQRQRGKIAQSRYEVKQKDLLRLCTNDEFRDLVLHNGARLVEGEIDQTGYDRRVRFLIDKLGTSVPLLQAHELFEAEIKAKEADDKGKRRMTADLEIPNDLKKIPSLEQKSPEEEKFSASPAEQGWTFESQPRPRRRSSADSRMSKDSEKAPSLEPRSPEEEKFFASDAEQGWTFETEPRPRRRSSASSTSHVAADEIKDSAAPACTSEGDSDATVPVSSTPATPKALNAEPSQARRRLADLLAQKRPADSQETSASVFGSGYDDSSGVHGSLSSNLRCGRRRVGPFEGDGWRVNIASTEPRSDVERPVRAVASR